MRTTRVKPASITAPAIAETRWVLRIAAGVAVLFVLLVPLRFIYLWRTAPTTTPTAAPAAVAVTRPASPARAVVYQPRLVSAFVPGKPGTRTYGPTLTTINDQSWQLRGYVISGCGSWYDQSGNKLAHSCKGPMPSVDGIVAFSADGSAMVRTNHCDPFTPGNNVDTCS